MARLYKQHDSQFDHDFIKLNYLFSLYTYNYI